MAGDYIKDIWEEFECELGDGDEHTPPELKNVKAIIWKEEFQELLQDILKTLKAKNISDLGEYSEDVIKAIIVVFHYPIDEKQEIRRRKAMQRETFEVAHVLPLDKKEAYFIRNTLGSIMDRFRWLVSIYGERWEELSENEKKQVIIHELLHIKPGKPFNTRPHNRIDREYDIMEKYLQAKNEEITQKAEMIAVAQIRKKKKVIEDER